MRWRLLIILNVIAAIAYVGIGWGSGLLTHVQSSPSGFFSVFSSNDSVQYRAVADWIFGAPKPDAAAWRPFLYPLLMGAAERVGGLSGIWLLNVALWFAMLNFTAAATFRFVRSELVAAIVFLALAFNGSLIVLTFKGLTEITTVALLAIWIYGISHLTLRPTPSQVAWAMLPAALLVVVKPEFELLLVVVAIVLAVGIMRSPGRGMAALVFAACLLPVAAQLALNEYFNGYFGISSIGEKTIRGYYLARFDIAIGQAHNVTEARLKMNALSNFEAARLVLGHFGDAVIVFFTSLKENLLAGSGFVGNGHQRIAGGILLTQRVYFLMLLSMIVLVPAALWRKRDVRLALLSVGILTVFFAGGLTFSQGDRITIVALPLWLVAFVLAIKDLGGGAAWRSLTARTTASSTPMGTRPGGEPEGPGA